MKKPTVSPSFQDLSSFVTFRIARVQNTLNAQASATLAAHCDLTLTEWRMLASIEARGQTTAAEIARHTQIDKGQVSRAVKSLKGRALLKAGAAATDQRQQTLTLSAQGRAVFERVVVVMRKRQEMLTQDIAPEDLRTFFSVLDKLQARAL